MSGTVDTALIVSIIGLIIIIAVHIVVIARWSGQIDGYLRAATDNFHRIDEEIKALRIARHDADGTIQLHSGAIRNLELMQRSWDRRETVTEG